jgi:hypothetical protein
MSPRRRLPPVRNCPRCGGEHRSLQEGAPCAACRRDNGGQVSLFAPEIETRRAARPVRETRVPYNVFPEGF